MAGIAQPGAPGTVTTFEDDTNADAALDADATSYSPADVVAKALASADTTDLGTFTKYYRSKCNLQNGDGVGTATTTFKAKNLSCSFDSGKTYAVSTVGSSNRWTIFGDKVVGAAGKPSGKNGANMDFATSTTVRGNVQLYGSKLRTSSGFLQFAPGASGLTGEIIDCLMETASGNVTIGVGGFGPQLIYNMDVTLGGTGVVSALIADYVERISIAVTGANAHCINTNATFAPRDTVFVGTPTIADVRGSSTCDLINPTFTGNAAQYFGIGLLGEWFTFNALTLDVLTGAPVPSTPIVIQDVFGATLFNGASDALGGISYGAGVYANALKARSVATVGGVVVATDQFPLTIIVNQSGATLSAYTGYSYRVSWPYSNLPSGYGKQLIPVTELVLMYAKGASGFFGTGVSASSRQRPQAPRFDRNAVFQSGMARVVQHSVDMEIVPDIVLPYEVVGAPRKDARGAVMMVMGVVGDSGN